MAWFTAEHRVLLAAVDQAAATAWDAHTSQLAWTLATFLEIQGHWHDYATTQRAAVDAADRLGDPTLQIRAHRLFANASTQLGRFDDAHTHLLNALDLSTRAGDQVGQARTHDSLAFLKERQGHYSEALDHAQRALALFRAADSRSGHAAALNTVGWLHAMLGDYQQALNFCQQAVALHQELGDRDGQGIAETWDSLGYVYHHLGDHRQAITSYQHALDLFRDLGHRYQQADTLTHLGDTHHADNPDAARAVWQQALTILEDLDHPDAEQVRTRLHNLDQHTPLTGPADHDPKPQL